MLVLEYMESLIILKYMIDLNIKTVHMLTKLFLKYFVKRDFDYILNVASLAAFTPGPLMSTYYATKSYIYSLTMEIKKSWKKSSYVIKYMFKEKSLIIPVFGNKVKYYLSKILPLDVKMNSIYKIQKRGD